MDNCVFYLVRHAHSEWSLDENRPLSAQGSRDGIRVADTLEGYPVNLIYTSPATRARQTSVRLQSGLG